MLYGALHNSLQCPTYILRQTLWLDATALLHEADSLQIVQALQYWKIILVGVSEALELFIMLFVSKFCDEKTIENYELLSLGNSCGAIM